MTDPVWTHLTRTHGRKAVMNPNIDDATLDAETARQVGEIFPLIRAELRGDEKRALDYGCGYGRFTPHLAEMVSSALGFDPCRELLAQRTSHGKCVWESDWKHLRQMSFDVIFTAMVLGGPDIDLEREVGNLEHILRPNGLMVVLDHMPAVEPPGRWWRFRPESVYVDAFESCGVFLRKIGMVRQLADPITILAGRKHENRRGSSAAVSDLVRVHDPAEPV